MTSLHLFAVTAGGGLGALARFGVNRAVGMSYRGALPLGTVLVNVVGSFALGLLATVLAHGAYPVGASPFLTTGFLGGFTTFSTYALEAVVLAIDGARLVSVVSAVAPLVLGCLAAACGAVLGGIS